MTPARCAVGGKDGDCYRACIASVLDLPTLAVPNFSLAGDWDQMHAAVRAWLNQRGLGIFRTYCSAKWELDRLIEVFSDANPEVPIILSAQCAVDPTGNHAVIAVGGSIVHDPSGAGVRGPVIHPDGDTGWYYLDILVANPALPMEKLQCAV